MLERSLDTLHWKMPLLLLKVRVLQSSESLQQISPRDEAYDSHLKALLSEAQTLYEQTEQGNRSHEPPSLPPPSRTSWQAVRDLPPPIAAGAATVTSSAVAAEAAVKVVVRISLRTA